MLPVSLDCPFLITSSVLSDAYFMYKNPISKEIKTYGNIYFTSLQKFNKLGQLVVFIGQNG
jgi:hypothetical protein